jgi:NifU-like protein involved in Fe-S cluster formation
MLNSIASQHIHSPRNFGELAGATHVGLSGTPGDGPHIRLWFIVKKQSATFFDALITKASYEANGCFSSIASASVVAQMLMGRTVGQAVGLDASDVDILLGGLPEGKGYCAQMAVDAIQNAFQQFAAEKNDD